MTTFASSIAGLLGLERLRASDHQLRIWSGEGHVDDLRAAEDLGLRVVRAQQVGGVGHQGRSGHSLEPSGHVPGVVRQGEQHELRLMLLHELVQRVRRRLGDVVREHLVVARVQGLGTESADRLGRLGRSRPKGDGRHRRPELSRLGQVLQGARLNGAVG
jgi:hypothetical protein